MTAEEARARSTLKNREKAEKLFPKWLEKTRASIAHAVESGHKGILEERPTKYEDPQELSEILDDKLKSILCKEGFKLSSGPGNTMHVEWR